MRPIDRTGVQGVRRRNRRRFFSRIEGLETRALLSTLYVNSQNLTGTPDGSQANPYNTIQAAINHSASGDTIQVAPGTYTEALTITHSLTLDGPNAGINPNTGSRGAEAVVLPPINNPTSGGLILVQANNVTIDGLTLDGSNASLSGGVLLNGVSSNAASGVTNVDTAGNLSVISGLSVKNDVIRNVTSFGVIADINNYSTATVAVSTGNSILNNKIDNIPTVSPTPGRGISIEDNFYADVEGNVVTRVATGIQAIQMNTGSGTGMASTISGNQVQDYLYGIYLWNLDTDGPSYNVTNNQITTENDPSTSPTNAGIKVDIALHTTSVSLSGNSISGAHFGYDLDFLTNNPVVTVTGGTLSGNDYGVQLSNADAPTSGPPLAPVQAQLSGVTIQGSKIAGLLVNDAKSVSTAPVTLTVDAATTVTGSPHGAILTGTYAKLVDAGVPSVSLSNTPPAQTTSTSASIGVSATDNVTSANDLLVSYSLDGGAAASASSPISLSGLGLGSHTIVVTATDQAGKVGQASYTWTIASAPTSAPSTPVLAPSSDTGISSSDGITKINTPQFTGTAPANSTVTLYAGNAVLGTTTASGSGSWSFTVGGQGSLVKSLADGVYAITATATGSSGLPSSPSSAEMVTIDTTPPTVQTSLSSQPNAAGWYNSPVTASFKASDGLSGLASAATGSYTFSANGRGLTHAFTVTDVAGNTTTVTVGPINLDTTPPVISIAAPPPLNPSPNGKPVNFTISGKVTDALSGVAGATISIQEMAGPFSAQAPLTLNKDGSFSISFPVDVTKLQKKQARQFTITVQATDLAGNHQQATTTVTIPGTGPGGPPGHGGPQGPGDSDGNGHSQGQGGSDGQGDSDGPGGPHGPPGVPITPIPIPPSVASWLALVQSFFGSPGQNDWSS